MVRAPVNLLQGTVDVLILKTLSWQPMHGFAVSRWIRQRTDGVLGLEDAALYQALHRLERRGWVEAEWGLSENNRRAKFYVLTPAGRRQLRAEDGVWRRYAAAVSKVLESTALEPA
ncbi:MAG: PadR family transcriptional regulator [Gemmatimonadaceae bacterium]